MDISHKTYHLNYLSSKSKIITQIQQMSKSLNYEIIVVLKLSILSTLLRYMSKSLN